jgi:hypothetical protein
MSRIKMWVLTDKTLRRSKCNMQFVYACLEIPSYGSDTRVNIQIFLSNISFLLIALPDMNTQKNLYYIYNTKASNKYKMNLNRGISA